MDNNFTDGYYNKVNEKDNEEIGVLSSQKADSSLIKENLDDKDQVRNTQSHTKKEENVAENVEGVNNTKDNNGLNSKTNSEDSPINNRIEINSQFPTSNIHDISALENDDEIDNNEDGRIKRPQHISSEPSTPDELIEDWERLHQAKLPKQARDFALLVAAIHLDKDDSRGVTVSDIKTLLGCKTIDAAEARKDRAVDEGLLVAHPTLKEGKQKMYFLSNFIHVVNERLKRKYDETPVSPDDITFAFIKVLSSRKCAYHHISLLTDLKYPQEDYECLNGETWIEKSSKNKTKISTFKLEDRRNCTLNVSKNGTVMISIECSKDQYKLHTYEGIAELFVSCGQILSIHQQETHNRLNVVPHPLDWRIVQFDNDKTISIAELKKEYPNINWHSKAGLTMRTISAAFRMYVKEMPEQGSSLRAELINSFKNSKTLSEKIKEIAKRDDAEYTPDDFLKDRLSERKDGAKDEDEDDGSS